MPVSDGCEPTNDEDADLIGNVATGHGEIGAFDETFEGQEKAVDLFEDENLSQQAADRLKLYQTGKPFRR